MIITGYADRLSVAPGEEIAFMVSCLNQEYTAALIRPSHVEHLKRAVSSEVDGVYVGREQVIESGSYVELDRPLPRSSQVGLEAWILPTRPVADQWQEVLAWEDGTGLFVDPRGVLTWCAGDATLSLTSPLLRDVWHRVRLNAGPDGAELAAAPERGAAETVRGPGSPTAATSVFRIGRGFDGKIEAPAVDDVARWDFSIGIGTVRVTDVGAGRWHGTTVNMPMRGVTGRRWTGRSADFNRTPEEYAAIHFHADDLEDARWVPDFTLTIPADLPSGMYAVELRAGDAQDQIPFFVTGLHQAPIAFLAPTFSYLAYSCETSGTKTSPSLDEDERVRMEAARSPGDVYAAEQGLLSLYDCHLDGSGTAFVSRLRPLTNMRPDSVCLPIWGPHQLGADLHVLDWLSLRDEPFEVTTDDDLHHDGDAALAGYQVVLTGTHPEYWSGPMLDAVQRFMDRGGNVMYLGGNGMYWVTDPHPDRPHVIEVRRTHQGTRAWESAPGEDVQQSTGEPGGLWRYRGRPPHRAYGIGMAAHGYDYAIGYERRPGSLDPSVSWIFDGVGEDEVIGDFGACMGGAAGFELDSFDPAQGSPPETVVLATAQGGFSDSYQGVVENVRMQDSLSGASDNPAVRADMSFLSLSSGGAVFCTGSICWGTSLTHDLGVNNVATITDNVLRRFSAGPAAQV